MPWLFLALYGTMTLVLAGNLVHLARRTRRPTRPFPGVVSVLIPARNEERNLLRLLPSLLRQEGIDFEVVVYDDASEDGTADVVRNTGDPRVRLLRGLGPPPGWVGKVHALYQATRAARGDTFLFLDADTALKDPGALARMMGRFTALPPHRVLTALPRFRGGAPLLVSGIPFGLLTNLPLPVATRWGGRFVAAMNGQCWVISREDYCRHEPHLHHRREVLEDVRIGQFLSGRGIPPQFADLQHEIEVWMYESVGDAWRGFRKNAYLLAGGRLPLFLPFLTLFVLTFVAAPLWSPGFLAWAIALKLVADRFSRFPLRVSLLAPVSFALWTALLVDSAASHISGRVVWKGRTVARGPAPQAGACKLHHGSGSAP